MRKHKRFYSPTEGKINIQTPENNANETNLMLPFSFETYEYEDKECYNDNESDNNPTNRP